MNALRVRISASHLLCAALTALVAPGLEQLASAGRPTEIPRCAADLDGSGAVNGFDLAMLLAEWGPCPAPCPADLFVNGQVNGMDLAQLLASWGEVQLIECVAVTKVEPDTAGPGETVTLTGNFPDPDLTNYCVLAEAPGDATAILFNVTAVSLSELTAIVGPIALDDAASHIMVGLGPGNFGPATVEVDGATVHNSWSWAASGPGIMTDVLFTPRTGGAAALGPPGSSFYGSLSGGDLVVTITGSCPTGTQVQVWPRAHHNPDPGIPGDAYVGYDAHIPCMHIKPGGTLGDCAIAICAAIEAAYLAHSPPIAIDCTTAPNPGGGVDLRLSLPGLSIDFGAFNIDFLGTSECPCFVPEVDVDANGTTDCLEACGDAGTCTGDFDGDGVVGPPDLGLLLAAFGGCIDTAGAICCGDFDGDGAIDMDDVNAFPAFGPCP